MIINLRVQPHVAMMRVVPRPVIRVVISSCVACWINQGSVSDSGFYEWSYESVTIATVNVTWSGAGFLQETQSFTISAHLQNQIALFIQSRSIMHSLEIFFFLKRLEDLEILF